MTMQDIVEVLGFATGERKLYGKIYTCNISTYKCDLQKKQTFELFNFEINHDSITIELPDGTTDEIYNYAVLYNEDHLTHYMGFIKRNVAFDITEYDDTIIYTVFSTLHEFGHWVYFDELNCDKSKYISQERKYRTEVMEILEPNYRKDKYREIPSEREADAFAFEHLEEILIKCKLREVNKNEMPNM